ncbi:hypothetical protein EVAR_27246_1 [Eumeta japonica]|uniref:Uncharacterized protein n=1 Tax=Eumeta variegata TaxID=151549 RepID=A0A4C1W0A9_EUMVA|nr:hypothetical protein EVAR_27246_1 [Eumeta japonica]
MRAINVVLSPAITGRAINNARKPGRGRKQNQTAPAPAGAAGVGAVVRRLPSMAGYNIRFRSYKRTNKRMRRREKRERETSHSVAVWDLEFGTRLESKATAKSAMKSKKAVQRLWMTERSLDTVDKETRSTRTARTTIGTELMNSRDFDGALAEGFRELYHRRGVSKLIKQYNREANEQASHQKLDDPHRPWTFITPKESLLSQPLGRKYNILWRGIVLIKEKEGGVGRQNSHSLGEI